MLTSAANTPPRRASSRRWATTKQVAEYTRQSDSKYEKMRLIGDGPPFYKAGKSVLYDLNEIDDWIAAQRRESTSDAVSASASASPADVATVT
jgi:Helix-turn-helix domain